VDSDKHSLERIEMTSAIPGLHRAKRRLASKRAARKPVVEELVDLVRDLHQLLENYAPRWYTEQLDTRLSKALAAADSAKKP
jgi:hypothetical protein